MTRKLDRSKPQPQPTIISESSLRVAGVPARPGPLRSKGCGQHCNVGSSAAGPTGGPRPPLDRAFKLTVSGLFFYRMAIHQVEKRACNAMSVARGRTSAYYADGSNVLLARQGAFSISQNRIPWSSHCRGPLVLTFTQHALQAVHRPSFWWALIHLSSSPSPVFPCLPASLPVSPPQIHFFLLSKGLAHKVATFKGR